MPSSMQRRPWRAPLALLLIACRAGAQSPDASDWGHIGGDPGGQYYSHLNEITRDNVTQLEVAWRYAAGEPLAGGTTPLLAFGSLYLMTPSAIVIALDPASGRERWRFARYRSAPGAQPMRLERPRSFAVWQSEVSDVAASCGQRLFVPTARRLAVLDATTGQPCIGFGDGIALDGEVASLLVHRGVLVLLMSAGELRGMDAMTGTLRWSLTFAALAAGANELDARGQLSLDAALGLVFVPGPGQLAADTQSGKVLWQVRAAQGSVAGAGTAATQSALVALNTPGGPLPVLAQPTPDGQLRLLRRETGRLVGRTSLPLLAGGSYGGEDAWGITVLDRGLCRRRVRDLPRAGSINPSNVAIDVNRNRMIVALNDLPLRLAPRLSGAQRGASEPLLSIFGLPCVRPPWGSLLSVDLQKRTIVWQMPLGASRELLPGLLPSRTFGTPNLGGPMVTAGGLIFIAAAADAQLRAFDVDTGRRLWRAALPAAGNSTPMSYRAGNDLRQYVVITAGGSNFFGNTPSDQVLAFALPRTRPGR